MAALAACAVAGSRSERCRIQERAHAAELRQVIALGVPPGQAECYVRISREEMREVYANPGYRARVAQRAGGTGNEPCAVERTMPLLRELAQLGTARLALDDLDETARLRLVVAHRSLPLCAGFWAEQPDVRTMFAPVSALPDADLHSRLALNARLVLAGFAAGPAAPQADRGDAIEAGMSALEARMTAEQRPALDAAVRAGESPPETVSCGGFLAVASHVPDLPSEIREAFLRAMYTAN